MGSGCTSGHGICGLGRLSPRSFVSVCTFVAVAAATSSTSIAIIDGGCASSPWLAPLILPSSSQLTTLLLGTSLPAAASLVLAYAIYALLRPATHPLVKPLGIDRFTPGYNEIIAGLHALLALAVGVTSGVGLVVAGMLDQHKVRLRLLLPDC